jgi:hypothetical protein
MTKLVREQNVEASKPAENSQQLPEYADTLRSGAHLFTFELGSEMSLWSAVPLRGHRNQTFVKDVIRCGYNELDKLAAWFTEFWQNVGDPRHRVHVHVSGPEILHRCFLIPAVPRSEINAVVRSYAKRVFPFDIDAALFGWKTIAKTEWAGGPKYEIYSQALGPQWNEWLSRMFGNLVRNIDLITSTGQHFEHLLGQVSQDFWQLDSYLIRLKGNELETGFFHNGHLEFFREVNIDSINDGEFIDQVRGIGRGEHTGTAALPAVRQPVSDEIKTAVGDALDYYHGQFGQRSVQTAYLCFAPEYVPEISAFIEERVRCHVVNLCESARIEVHQRLSEISGQTECYHRWVSVFPKRNVSKDLVDLSPTSIRNTRSEKRYFRYSLIAIVLLVLTLATVTTLKVVRILYLQDRYDELLTTLSPDQATAELNALAVTEQRLAQLRQNLAANAPQTDYRLVVPLKLLSQVSRDQVRLDGVDMVGSADGQSFSMRVTGIVMGPADRQESQLYGYMSTLESHPKVKSVELEYKRATSQFASQETHFALQVVTRK